MKPHGYGHLRIGLMMLVGAILSLYAASVFWILWTERTESLAQAGKQAEGYARIIEEHASRALGEADHVLVKAVGEVQGGKTKDMRLFAFLQEELARTPQLRSILIVGPDGRVKVNSSEWPTRPFDVSDRDYFTRLRDDPSAGLHLGVPVKSRFNNKWLVSMARRLSGPDGRFEGVVIGAVAPEYFADFYNTFDIGGGAVYLFRNDGRLLIRHPFSESAMSIDYRQMELFRKRLPEKKVGGFRVKSSIDGRFMISAYRSFPGFPILAHVGLLEEDFLRSWRSQMVRQAGGGLVLILLAGSLTLMLIRRIDELEAGTTRFAAQQEELREAGERAIANRRMLEDGIKGLENAFVLWSADDRLHISNERFVEMFSGIKAGPDPVGRSFEELVGMEIPGNAGGDSSLEEKGAALDRRIAIHRNPTGEFAEQRLDDGRWLMFSEHRTRDGGIVGIYIDISERKRSEEALRESEERLLQSQKMEAIGRLAGGIAHDFNNLLVVITGYADLLLKRMEGDPRVGHELKEIQAAGKRAGELTRQLLAFSRRQLLQPRVLDLNEVVSGLEGMLRRLIGEDVKLVTNLSPGLGMVKADLVQIEQVVMNLAVNARDAMPDGGTLSISTADVDIDGSSPEAQNHSAAPGPYVALEVCDTGMGMDESVMKQMFEPFFTTKEQGKGTGLGLSTVYGIIAQSGGYISAESSAGAGSVFRMVLPRVPEEARRPIEISGDSLRRREGTILLVEDEEAVRKLVREILAGGGYQVVEASGGGEAVERCSRHEGVVDLVVTDVVMPGMPCSEMVDRIRALRPGIRVLYMSGYTDSQIGRRGVSGVGANYIQKPFHPDDLMRKVAEALDA